LRSQGEESMMRAHLTYRREAKPERVKGGCARGEIDIVRGLEGRRCDRYNILTCHAGGFS